MIRKLMATLPFYIGLSTAAALVLFGAATAPAGAQREVSRVYVTAYSCSEIRLGTRSASPGTPTVELYSQSQTGMQALAKPKIDVTVRMQDAVQFYFDAAPGYYELFIDFPGTLCAANGPLAVITGAARHLFVMTSKAVMDWHARLALAGVLPASGVSVRAVLLDRPARCGDDPRDYTIKESDGVVDAGVYYANLSAYEEENKTIALMLKGALFTERAVLLMQPLGGPSGNSELVIKNLDYDPVLLAVAAAGPNRFACIPGF
jgi:hypothetical protein